MGGPTALEKVDRGWIDHRWDCPGDHAALRLLLALGLLRWLRLLQALLGLLHLLARLATQGFAADRSVGAQGRQYDRDNQLPLHAVDVTTPRLNRK